MRRHLDPGYCCPVASCSKPNHIYYRQDKLREHIRRAHSQALVLVCRFCEFSCAVDQVGTLVTHVLSEHRRHEPKGSHPIASEPIGSAEFSSDGSILDDTSIKKIDGHANSFEREILREFSWESWCEDYVHINNKDANDSDHSVFDFGERISRLSLEDEEKDTSKVVLQPQLAANKAMLQDPSPNQIGYSCECGWSSRTLKSVEYVLDFFCHFFVIWLTLLP